jgi:hypothetical protein
VGLGRTQKREAAALSLARGQSITEAATAAQTTERTIYRWARETEFQRRVGALREGLIHEAGGALAGNSTEAVKVLKELLTSQSENVRMKAADRLLAHTIRVCELTELARRIEELEQLLGNREKT